MKILEYSAEELEPTKLLVINGNSNFELSDKESIYQYLRYTDLPKFEDKVRYRVGTDVYTLIMEVDKRGKISTCNGCAFYNGPLRHYPCAPLIKYMICDIKRGLKFKVIDETDISSVSLSKVREVICNEFCPYHSDNCMEIVGIELCVYKKIIEGIRHP